MQTQETLGRLPRTQAVRRALRLAGRAEATSDLLFFEAWEMDAQADLGTLLRAAQIRRANPALAAEIEAELKAR